MKNFHEQDLQLTYFHLYCLNMKCQHSIYHHSLVIDVPLTAGNLVAAHVCKGCDQPMVSAMDIEIKHALAGTKSNRKMGLL